MKEKILGAFLMLLLPAVCSAGEEPAMKPQKQSDANITGHVVDAKTYEHLAFATIAVKGTTIGIATDATGHYFLKNLPQGRFTLVASSVGYRSAEQTVEISPDKTIEVNFSLTEEALSVEEVVVSASRTDTNKKTSPTYRIGGLGQTLRIDRLVQSGRDDEFPVGIARRNQLRQLRYDPAAHKRTRRAVFAGTARQPPDLQFAGIGLRP